MATTWTDRAQRLLVPGILCLVGSLLGTATADGKALSLWLGEYDLGTLRPFVPAEVNVRHCPQELLDLRLGEFRVVPRDVQPRNTWLRLPGLPAFGIPSTRTATILVIVGDEWRTRTTIDQVAHFLIETQHSTLDVGFRVTGKLDNSDLSSHSNPWWIEVEQSGGVASSARKEWGTVPAAAGLVRLHLVGPGGQVEQLASYQMALEVTNDGSDPVTMTEVATSCACTQVGSLELPRLLSAKALLAVPLALHTGDRQGTITVQVACRFRSPSGGEWQSRAELAVEIRSVVSVEPQRVLVEATPEDGSDVVPVTLALKSPRLPAADAHVEAPAQLRVSCTADADDLKLAVSALPGLRAGTSLIRIPVRWTLATGIEEISIPVTVAVRDLVWTNRDEIYVDASVRETYEQHLRVASRRNVEVESVALISPVEWASITALRSGEGWDVAFRFTPSHGERGSIRREQLMLRCELKGGKGHDLTVPLLLVGWAP